MSDSTREAFDETACLAGIARNDDRAAQALVLHVHPLVSRVVRAHRSPYVSDEDLAQEVYVKIFTHLDDYRVQEGVPIRHWVARLAVRVCLDALRAQRRRPFAHLERPAGTAGLQEYLMGQTSEAIPTPADAIAARDYVNWLLSHLMPRDRALLVWLDVEGLSVAEVAELTGTSRVVVKVRAFRARRCLRAVIRTEGTGV